MTYHPYSCNFEIFFLPIFCNIAKYDFAKFHVKSIFLSGFTQGGEGGGGGGWHMIRQKYLGADRVKVSFKLEDLLITI